MCTHSDLRLRRYYRISLYFFRSHPVTIVLVPCIECPNADAEKESHKYNDTCKIFYCYVVHALILHERLAARQ